ncbi:MAG: transporter substrate-binding domain-containing protein [Clostridia bacterium]|nr:transporter substrate-binding domain-containing protein [Clostridia bacterium]
MKIFKRILCLALVAMCCLSLFACGNADSDWNTIKKSGKLVIGITIYEPMNYYEEGTTNLIGFDTEFAQAVCKKLGVEPEFQTIDWKQKEAMLKAGNIDAIWNGLTVTEDRKENMDFTKSYLKNRQCIVINKANADKYTDTASLAAANISAEAESAGESAILADANLKTANYTASTNQQNALLGLNAGNFDAIIIDHSMASSSCGKGDYADLMILESIQLEDEYYAIGFRVGSDMTEKVNAIIDELVEDGTLAAIAAKYGKTEVYEAAIAAN